MRWNKLGLIAEAQPWAVSHATAPTPYLLSKDIIRVFVTAMDDAGRGQLGYVDVASDDPKIVLAVSNQPLLSFGGDGCFDDNGVMGVSVVCPKPGQLYMYYVGFELCTNVPYRMFTGLAISDDGGNSFIRYSKTPILDRSDEELFFRCGPFVMIDDGLFKLWYIAGCEWTEVAGKRMPVYELRYQESVDGIHWQSAGRVSMRLTGVDEHGFGRPWVIKRGTNDYQLFYSIRSRSLAAYRLGYAESMDGSNWVRKDGEMGLDVSSEGFDSDAIMYSAVLSVNDKTYCFYNGNNFGEHGFGVAELIK
jgi:hypothetical protein